MMWLNTQILNKSCNEKLFKSVIGSPLPSCNTTALYGHVTPFRPGTHCLWNKGIGDAGSSADIRMLWSAMVCLGLLFLLLMDQWPGGWAPSLWDPDRTPVVHVALSVCLWTMVVALYYFSTLAPIPLPPALLSSTSSREFNFPWNIFWLFLIAISYKAEKRQCYTIYNLWTIR